MRDVRERKNYNAAGMTLVELTVALALFGILALASLNLIYYGFRTNKVVEDKIDIINNMNSALGVISKAIRENDEYSDIDLSDSHVLELSNDVSFKANDGVIRKYISGNPKEALTTKDKIEVIDLSFNVNPANTNSIKIELSVRTRNGETIKSTVESAIRSDL